MNKNRIKGPVFLLTSLLVVIMGFQNCNNLIDNSSGDSSSKSCEVGGTRYPEGSMPSLDGCNRYSCKGGVVFSTLMLCEELVSCVYDEKTYTHSPGDQFLAKDGCDYCRCNIDGTTSCSGISCDDKVQCEFDGNIYQSGDSFKNSCNTCSCGLDGQVLCTKKDCPPNEEE